MEAAGSVALYENCEIVSVWDDNASTHNSYVSAPKMAVSSKVGKGLVYLNSTVKESEDAAKNGQCTYLARSPWQSGYYNQVAYINTQCSGVEVSPNSDSKSANAPWYGNMIPTDYEQTIIGWKMDSATAKSLGLTEKDYILNDAVTNSEYNGRRAILNRIYNTGKLRYEKDAANYWDIDALISELGYEVATDESKAVLDGEVEVTPTVYTFDGNTDYSAICNGFAQDNAKPHYVGQSGATITLPLTGKCYVEVYGYYSGTAEAKADTQGFSVMFFNNYSTGSQIEQDYIVFDDSAREFVLTAKATTYITKIVVTPDPTIQEATLVKDITISASSKVQTVGVGITLTATVNKDATNKAVIWSSSDETIAEINPYTGRVTFKAAGSVTFKATACDGSEVYAEFVRNPKEANWTVSEWYTTDSSNITEEEGAENIENFDTNTSAYKNLGSTYIFTNNAGKTITTGNGLKLNSAGLLSIATTKPATLTIITCDAGKVFVTPNVALDGGTAIEPVSTTVSEDGKTITYVYQLTAAGLWNIQRGDFSQENNPILYAKCEYKEAVISEATGLSFKGTNYTETKTGIPNDKIIYPAEAIDATGTTVHINEFKLTNCASNGNAANWLIFNTGASIEFKVSGACTLLVGYYSALQTIKFNGEVVEGNKTSVSNGGGDIVEYEISGAGTVTIEATTNNYLGFVGVVFKTLEMKKAEACAQLDKSYPASKYTQNENYATVLAAQKEAINAAEDATQLKEALAAAILALDALEVDPVVEPTGPVKDLVFVWADVAAEYEDGATVNSTSQITFVNCVRHDGTYIRLSTDNAVKINLAEGAILKVHMPYSSGVKVNGVDVELVNEYLVYTATTTGEVVITGAAGQSYIQDISVVSYIDDLSFVFQDVSENYEASAKINNIPGVTFEGCQKHDGQHIALKENNKVTVYLKANTRLVVSMLYSNGVTINGEAATLTDGILVYDTTEATIVEISGTAGSAYIQSIKVMKYLDTLSYVFAEVSDNYEASAKIESIPGVTFEGCQKHDSQHIALKENNKVTIYLQANTRLVVSMLYSNGVTINGEAATLTDGILVYDTTEATIVEISGTAGSAYIQSIKVMKYLDTLSYVFTEVSDNYEASAKIESIPGVTFEGCQKHDGQHIALKENNKVTIYLQANTKLVVSMLYSNGVTINGEAATLTDGILVYETTEATIVEISGTAGSAYIQSITVTSTEQAPAEGTPTE